MTIFVFPDSLRDFESRRVFTGVGFLLHYLVYNRSGVIKLQISRFYFRGDLRRFSYSIRTLASHLYRNFYDKISGNTMAQWVHQIDDFWSCRVRVRVNRERFVSSAATIALMAASIALLSS